MHIFNTLFEICAKIKFNGLEYIIDRIIAICICIWIIMENYRKYPFNLCFIYFWDFMSRKKCSSNGSCGSSVHQTTYRNDIKRKWDVRDSALGWEM